MKELEDWRSMEEDWRQMLEGGEEEKEERGMLILAR